MQKGSLALAETLRQQILNGLKSGIWHPGGKLPSVRGMAREMGGDPRLIADAYRMLADEGLVELKARSGAYISAAAQSNGPGAGASETWLSKILADGIARELPLGDLAELLRRATESLRLTAFVVAPTHDQVRGLRRELVTYYGFEAEGMLLEELEPSTEHPLQLRQADVVITTGACLDVGRRIAGEIGIPCISVSVRLDLIGPAWQTLMQSPTFIVVTDERFGTLVRDFLASRGATGKVEVLVCGQDDLGSIPRDAVVYVTQSAREKLGELKLNGSILPPARILSPESSQLLTGFIVEANLAARRSRPRRD